METKQVGGGRWIAEFMRELLKVREFVNEIVVRVAQMHTFTKTR